MLKLPTQLYPFYNKTDEEFVIPNIAVGKVHLNKCNHHIPVFSCFFSHACFLPSKKWTLVEYPVKNKDTAEKLRVFIDPATLHVFGNSIVSFWSDNTVEGVNICEARLQCPIEAEQEPFTPQKEPQEQWCKNPSHWKSVGLRYKEFYDILRQYEFKPPEVPDTEPTKNISTESPKITSMESPKAISTESQNQLCDALDLLSIQYEGST